MAKRRGTTPLWSLVTEWKKRRARPALWYRLSTWNTGNIMIITSKTESGSGGWRSPRSGANPMSILPAHICSKGGRCWARWRGQRSASPSPLPVELRWRSCGIAAMLPAGLPLPHSQKPACSPSPVCGWSRQGRHLFHRHPACWRSECGAAPPSSL